MEDMVAFVERMKFAYGGNAKAYWYNYSKDDWKDEWGQCTWAHDAVIELLKRHWEEL